MKVEYVHGLPLKPGDFVRVQTPPSNKSIEIIFEDDIFEIDRPIFGFTTLGAAQKITISGFYTDDTDSDIYEKIEIILSCHHD